MYAACCKNESGAEIVEALLNIDNSFVNRTDSDGIPSLFYANDERTVDTFELLLARGADLNIKNNMVTMLT